MCELTWLLGCTGNLGMLTRAHAYKDAQARDKAGELSIGTFNYPVLMAADILIYGR